MQITKISYNKVIQIRQKISRFELPEYHLHNNTRSRRRPMTTMRSNDTLVDTPFQLISGFFHVNQGVLCSEHAEQASSRGVLEGGGGGGNRLAK